ncbi:MAG: glycosyltransferase family protein [Mucilaginibacter sp.]
MRIFLSFLQGWPDHPIPAYSFWQHYIKNGIEEAGHQWSECPDVDWALGLVPKSDLEQEKWKDEAWGRTVTWLKEHPADLFLSYLYPRQIDVSAIREIQKAGTPCVNFFCDHVRDFKKLPAEFGVFDLNWAPEHKAIKLYAKNGYPSINLSMPMWVEPKYRIFREETNRQITFIGSKDIQRKLLFEHIIQKEPSLPLAVYGKGWQDGEENRPQAPSDYNLQKKLKFNLDFIKDQGIAPFFRKIKQRNIGIEISGALSAKVHPSPAFEQYNALTAQSMITLGVNRFPSFAFPIEKPDTYSRLRDIEAPMLGACYITEWTDGIDELYDIENEIAVYRNEAELISTIKELQADPERRKRLKINGQKRALEDHSIPVSLNRLISKLGIKDQ